MTGNKAFRIALLISITAHSSLFMPWARLDTLFKSVEKPKPQHIEVNYLEIRVTPKKKMAEEVIQKALEEPLGETATKQHPPMPQPVALKEPAVTAAPNLKLEEGSTKLTGAYLDYYNAIREKIKATLLSLYRPAHEGEVYLEFTLDPDGSLVRANIMDEKSSSYKELRNVTLKGLKKASPFPPFPDEVEEPQIDFNVLVSFRK
jgi:protein TonB